ncbi:MAG: putative PEP-binding protein, partial [Negativibacillus sp.]|nr:putative PEP-binding protein [Negativibacillus sp.]
AAFFSIGTNDLTQYTMAVDRGNAKVENLYKTMHPAVLRSIRSVIRAAREAGIPVGMCGEAAADPALIPLLLSFGLNELSVNSASILRTRKIVSLWKHDEAQQVEQAAMALDTAQEVEAYMASVRRA